MSLSSFFSYIYKTIKKLKTSFFLLTRKEGKIKFDELIYLQQIVSMNHIKFDNIFSEYEKIPSNDMKTDQIKLKDLNQDKILADVFLENITYIIENINNLFEPVTSYVKEYFQNKNAHVNYKLQKSLKFLTIILCIFAFLQLCLLFIKPLNKMFAFIVSYIKSLGI